MTTTPHISAYGNNIPFHGVILLFAIRILDLCPPDLSGQMTYRVARNTVSKAPENAARDRCPEALRGRVDLGKLICSVATVTTTVASDPCCCRDQTYRSLYSVTIPDRRRKVSRNPRMGESKR